MSLIEKLKEKNKEQPNLTLFTQNIPKIPVYQFDLTNSIDSFEIAKLIKDFNLLYPKSRLSSISGWHSNFNTHELTNVFDNIIEVIRRKIMLCLEYPNYDIKITDSWAVIYEYGDKASAHNHSISSFSTVYYAQCSSQSSPLEFINGPSIRPYPGLLLVFPGYVYHYVPESTEYDQRIVFASNYILYPKK